MADRKPLQPGEACMARGLDGKVDIDLIRRSPASAQAAAAAVSGRYWKVLAAEGWSIERVRIVSAGAPAEEEAPPAEPAPKRRRPAPTSALHVEDHMTAEQYRAAVTGGLVRFGGGRGK